MTDHILTEKHASPLPRRLGALNDSSEYCISAANVQPSKAARVNGVARPITVEDQAWVCADVFVMPGITIGRGAIVAARSLVTKDVPPFTRVQGSPAKAVGIRQSSSA